MTRLTAGAAIALGLMTVGLWIAVGCDQSVDTNRGERIASSKEADDAPTPLPRADAGATDEGGDIPPAPTPPDEGSEGEKPNSGGSGDSSGDSGGGSGGGGGCEGGSWSGGGCSY